MHINNNSSGQRLLGLWIGTVAVIAGMFWMILDRVR
jgi:hypothetical protein